MQFTALNGGPHFKFNEAVSFAVDCETQDEVDYYWDKLGAGGAEPAMRLAEGQVRRLLADRADGLPKLLSDPDRAKVDPGDAGDAADEEARHRGARAAPPHSRSTNRR